MVSSRAGDSQAEAEFWDRIDSLVRRALAASDPWDANDLANEIAGVALADGEASGIAGRVYVFWMGLSDLFEDDRLGVVPPEGAQAVLRRAAAEWLATTPDDRTELIKGWEGSDLVAMVRSLGYAVDPPRNPRVEQPWRGRWDDIAWAVDQIGVTHSPYAAAQRVLRDLKGESVLWQTAGGDRLSHLLREWDANQDERARFGQEITDHLRSLSAEDVPPLGA